VGTHRQGPSNASVLNGSTVTCPWHRAQFKVCTGAVLRGPAADPLKTLKVVVEGEIGRVKTIQMHRMAAFTWLDSRTVPNDFWSDGIIC
jgi:hypothetical protein